MNTGYVNSSGIIDMVSAIVTLVFLVSNYIPKWLIFQKMGLKPWYSIIPLFSAYVLYKKIWSSKAAVAIAFLKLGRLAFPPVGVACTVLEIILLCKLSDAFHKSDRFTVGLILLNPIFMWILACGESTFDPAFGNELSR